MWLQEEKTVAELDEEDEELIKSITFRVILYANFHLYLQVQTCAWIFLTLLNCWLLQNSKDYVKRIDDDDDDDEEFGIPGQSSITAKVLITLYSSFPFLFLFHFVGYMFLIINCSRITLEH
jgi:hypothetical protein